MQYLAPMHLTRHALVLLAAACTLALPACEGDDPGETARETDPGTAPEQEAPAEATEVVAGGGRVKGGNVVMDVQSGHGASQRQAASGERHRCGRR